MKKHTHANKYDKQRKYYDNQKPVSNPVQNEAVSYTNNVSNVGSVTNTTTSNSSNGNSNANLNFVPQEKFLISVRYNA